MLNHSSATTVVKTTIFGRIVPIDVIFLPIELSRLTSIEGNKLVLDRPNIVALVIFFFRQYCQLFFPRGLKG